MYEYVLTIINPHCLIIKPQKKLPATAIMSSLLLFFGNTCYKILFNTWLDGFYRLFANFITI